jgi:hypothetical protein
MRYTTAIDLWDYHVAEAVYSGKLKLQPGQWVRCGSDNLSRFVRLTSGGSIHAAHWNGSGKARNERFQTLLAVKG